MPIEDTRFGFIWGHTVVERVCVLPSGGAVVYVTGGKAKSAVEVYVSPTGKSVRVFRSASGKELK